MDRTQVLGIRPEELDLFCLFFLIFWTFLRLLTTKVRGNGFSFKVKYSLDRTPDPFSWGRGWCGGWGNLI